MTRFFLLSNIAVFMFWGALPGDRTGIQFTRTIRRHYRVQIWQNSDHVSLSRLRLLQPGVPGRRVYIPPPPGTGGPSYILGNWVPFFVAHHDSLGYGEGILTGLDMGRFYGQPQFTPQKHYFSVSGTHFC
jgi:hypothetical protein